MLNAIRKHAYSWTVRVLLGLVTGVFIFWGIGTGLFAQVHPVATVNGIRILPVQVDSEAERIRRQFQSELGANAASALQGMNLRQDALQLLIEQQLVSDEARHLGIHIGEDALQDKIASSRGFQRDGEFDFTIYQEVLRENGMTPTDFENGTRTQMEQDTLRQMIDDGVQISSDEARHAYDLLNQQLALSYIELGYSDFRAKVSPTDQQLQEFYKKHLEAFREPERMKIEYIHYQPLALASNVNPSDKEIQGYYNRYLKTRYTHPDEVHARHILISVAAGATSKERDDAKAKAEDILNQARASGADFAKLAAKYSDDPSTRLKGGDLGFFPRGQMIKPFEDAAFSMKPGEARVVQTNFGYHVVKVDEVKAAHVDLLAEAKPKIVESIRNEAGGRLGRQALQEDVSAATSGTSMEELAKKRGLEVVETPPFAQNEPVKGAESDRDLAASAFKLQKGDIRAVPAAVPYLVKVIDRTPSSIPPFAQIQDKVRQIYIRVHAETLARTQAQKLLEQIKAPEDFEKIAAANKLEVHKVTPFPRLAQSVPGIGEFPEVTDAASASVKVPGVINRVMEHAGESYLFEVTSRTLPSDDDWKAAEKSFTEEYVAQRRAQVWTRFVDDLKARADIVIHPDQLGQGTAESSM